MIIFRYYNSLYLRLSYIWSINYNNINRHHPYIYISMNQSSNYDNNATPLLVQCYHFWSAFNLIVIMKLVEWPVVNNVPLLLLVL